MKSLIRKSATPRSSGGRPSSNALSAQRTSTSGLEADQDDNAGADDDGGNNDDGDNDDGDHDGDEDFQDAAAVQDGSGRWSDSGSGDGEEDDPDVDDPGGDFECNDDEN